MLCVSVVLQKLDRAWYDFDGGYDDRNNPFADIPEEYTKKKEEQMAKHAVKRMSAQQRQINKVRDLSLSLPLSLSLSPPSLSLSFSVHVLQCNVLEFVTICTILPINSYMSNLC